MVLNADGSGAFEIAIVPPPARVKGHANGAGRGHDAGLVGITVDCDDKRRSAIGVTGAQ